MRGIYIIKNLANNKVYIGKAKDIEFRKYQHFTLLRANKHVNRHLQNAYNKYGEENFEFNMLYCANGNEDLNELEKFYINKYQSNNQDIGYNKTSGGEGGTINDEIKAKISIGHRGVGTHLDFDTVRHIKMALVCCMDRQEIFELFNIKRGSLTDISTGKNFSYICPELNDKIYNLKQKMIDNRNKEIIRLYDSGLRIIDIVEKIHLTGSIVEKCVYKYRHKNKIYKRRKLNIKQEKEIIDLYFNKNMSTTKIATLYSVSSTTISSIIYDYQYQ